MKRNVTVTNEESLMRKYIGGRCSNCNSFELSKTLNKHDDLCESCYYDKSICNCENCGREITPFDYNDFEGLCGYCYEGY